MRRRTGAGLSCLLEGGFAPVGAGFVSEWLAAEEVVR